MASVQVSVESDGLMDIMVQLLAQMENLETANFRQGERVSGKTLPEESQTGGIIRNEGVVVCYRWAILLGAEHSIQEEALVSGKLVPTPWG